MAVDREPAAGGVEECLELLHRSRRRSCSRGWGVSVGWAVATAEVRSGGEAATADEGAHVGETAFERQVGRGANCAVLVRDYRLVFCEKLLVN